jgi:hypothetical protein
MLTEVGGGSFNSGGEQGDRPVFAVALKEAALVDPVGCSLHSSIVCGRTRNAPQSGGQAGAVS